ncbi:MAG: hypothetical protein ACRYFK_09345 [Janthinobacterium lividum]
MEPEIIIEQATRILAHISDNAWGFTEAQEFLRIYAGENSAFYKQISSVSLKSGMVAAQTYARLALESFISYVKKWPR